MPTSKLVELAQVYQEQLGVYRQMLSLAEEQVVCVESGNMTMFGELLERRDKLSGEMDRLSAAARVIGTQIADELGLEEINLSALRGRLPGSQIEPVADALTELASAIMKIQAVDEKTAAVLKDVISGINGQEPATKRSQVAMKAYTKFVDKQR